MRQADLSRHTIDKTQPRPRTQNGKVEENDNPLKRPSLFEARSRKSQTGTMRMLKLAIADLSTDQNVAEEIFLGPKMSFASASAARQGNKVGNGEDKTAQEDEGRPKFDRFATRDKPARDQENKDRDNTKQKPKYGHRDHLDEDATGDGRPRRVDHHNDRAKEQRDGGVSLDGTSNRRSGPPRGGKLDQPWFRDTARGEPKESGRHEGNGESSWRERERNRVAPGREERSDRQPEWMQDTVMEEPEHTFDDFAKWKERMKAGTNEQDDKSLYSNTTAASAPREASTSQSIAPGKEAEPKTTIPEGGVFGVWGEAKRDGEILTPKVTSKPKSSRFAGFFAPKEETPQETALELTSPIIEAWRQPPPKDEDQEGFQRMMNMLRLGGTLSQGPQKQGIGEPPPNPLMEQKLPPMHMFGHEQGVAQPKPRPRDMPAMPQSHHPGNNVEDGLVTRHVLTSPPAQSQQQQSHQPLAASRPPQQRTHQPPSEPARNNNDSDFLLKLIQQPRASPAFNEGQIYGQNYQQRSTSSEVNNVLNGYASRPIEPKARGPPPGFPSTTSEQAFRSSNGLAGMSSLADDDRFQPQQRYMLDQHRTPLSHYEQSSMFALQQESKPQDVRPPPGFSTGPRAAPQGMPHGSSAYVSHQPLSHQQHQQPAPQQHQMISQHHLQQLARQHQLRDRMPLQPPSFNVPTQMQGPPNYPQQQRMQPQRRPTNPSSMGAPPGYEGYGDMARRGPGITYPSYLDQRGGGY